MDTRVTVVACPTPDTGPSAYSNNRAPLLAAPLLKLPLGAIRPAGWLKHQLDLMIDGMTGRLGEISSFLAPDNGWFGTDKNGWEEQPYWFRGFYSLARLTGHPRLLAEADRWIEAVLSSQTAEGYFGAAAHRRVKGYNGQVICDLWPHMVMLYAVIRHYEATGDARVIPFMTRFFAFCRDLGDELLPPFRQGFGQNWLPVIQYARAGDMIPHIHWLYNQTGDAWLLPLASTFYQRMWGPDNEWLSGHVINFTQRFGYAGAYAAQTRDPRTSRSANIGTPSTSAHGASSRAAFSGRTKISAPAAWTRDRASKPAGLASSPRTSTNWAGSPANRSTRTGWKTSCSTTSPPPRPPT